MVMIYCATISVVAMCIGSLICSYICIYINSYFSENLIKLSIREQLMDYTPLFILAFITTWIPAYFITTLPIWAIAQLAIGGSMSFILYFAILFITKNNTLNDLLKLIQPRIPTHTLKKWVNVFIRT